MGGDVRGLKELHACGCPIDAVDEHGRTCLYVAALAGYEEAVEWLLSEGADASMVAADDGRTALHAAAAMGHTRCCQLLFDSLDAQASLREMRVVDNAGRTIGEVAAAAQHLDIVRVLLEVHTKCANVPLLPEEKKKPAKTPNKSPDRDKVMRAARGGYAPIIAETPKSSESQKPKPRVKTP